MITNEKLIENGYSIRYVLNPTEEQCLLAVNSRPLSLVFIKNQTVNICKQSVEKDGLALQYVTRQTEEICLKAVAQNPYSFRYVVDQTYKLQLEALNRIPQLVDFIKDPDNHIFSYAIRINPRVITSIRHPSEKLCKLAIKLDPFVIKLLGDRISPKLWLIARGLNPKSVIGLPVPFIEKKPILHRNFENMTNSVTIHYDILNAMADHIYISSNESSESVVPRSVLREPSVSREPEEPREIKVIKIKGKENILTRDDVDMFYIILDAKVKLYRCSGGKVEKISEFVNIE